jgi:hypothetical protein
VIHDSSGDTVYYYLSVWSVGLLSDAFHVYGLYWHDDGSAHGSLEVFVDGQSQGPPTALVGYDNLHRIENQTRSRCWSGST